MKIRGLFAAGLFLLTSVLAFGFQEPVDTTVSVEGIQPLVSRIDVTGLKFEFKNDKDPRTLVLLETGNLSLVWEEIKTTDSYLGFRYRMMGASEWLSITAEVSALEAEISGLPENEFFEYQLGTGNSGESIVYADEIAVFNSISPSIFGNNQAKGKEEAAKITWGIEHNKLESILHYYPNASFTLKWNTKIGKKQNETDETKSPWEKEEGIDINKVSKSIKELTGGENYVYKLGLDLGNGQVIWANEGKFTTERYWGIFKLLVLIGALGMFIFGMKIMSEGLQQASGARLRKMLGSITSNRVSGVLTGFGITSVVQSSSVTTVMTVSFVNAGLLTLRQSAGVMMGANIGTTITAWLILLFGFKVDVASYALIFIAFGAPLMFFSRGKAKSWASVIIGFSLLFMGLDLLKDSVPSLGADSALVQFFVEFKDVWYGPLMFVFLGALVTVVIQSSSAAMALTMTLVGGGVIPFEVAAAMILGENIGTTITAELASIIGNVHAKRSARIHSLFNIIGVTWAILLFPFILKGIAYFIEGDPYTNGDAANTGLALFHTSFNTINVLLLLGFVPWLVKMATKSVKSRGAADEEFHLDYIGTGMMGTPELAVLEAKKEIAKFGEITSRMNEFTRNLLTERNKKEKHNLHKKIEKYEEITDRVEIEVANYLARVSEGEMTEETAQNVRAMNSIVNDLERIGDSFYQMSKAIERKEELKIYFLPEQRAGLQEMFDKVDKAFEIMCDNLNADWEGVSLEDARNAEDEINEKRDELRELHLNTMNRKDFNMEGAMVFNNLYSLCEKVGDNIINVSEAIVGEI